MKVEIVTHCFRYATLLRFQLSSLVLWPPKDLEVTVTVFYTESDAETATTLEWFGLQQLNHVRWHWWPLPVERLCRRSIGRNLAALNANADWVWFCDADYWFDASCWQHLATELPKAEKLVFPREVRTHRNHSAGDECIMRGAATAGLIQADRAEFLPRQMRCAIGGIQLARGDLCRRQGYLKHSVRAQTPADSAQFTRCREDVSFRKQLGTRGVPIDIPGVYRIRHSRAGRDSPGLVL